MKAKINNNDWVSQKELTVYRYVFPELSPGARKSFSKLYKQMVLERKRKKFIDVKVNDERQCSICHEYFPIEQTLMLRHNCSSKRKRRFCFTCHYEKGKGI